MNAIDNIEALIDGRQTEEFRQNVVLRAALERFVEIISEASRHLPDEWKSDEAAIPWREIAAIGNVIRHAYDGVDLDRLWLIANDDLSALKGALLRMQKRYFE